MTALERSVRGRYVDARSGYGVPRRDFRVLCNSLDTSGLMRFWSVVVLSVARNLTSHCDRPGDYVFVKIFLSTAHNVFLLSLDGP